MPVSTLQAKAKAQAKAIAVSTQSFIYLVTCLLACLLAV
jgi:hypothetical protein